VRFGVGRLFPVKEAVSERPQQVYSPPVEYKEGQMSVFFCPRDDCEEELFVFLNNSRYSIHCAVYELNLPRIISLLENKNREIDVRVVVDDYYYTEVEGTGFARQDGKQGLMHNKFCVVDGIRVYTGSFNPTLNCAYKNNNNMLVIESEYLARNYENEFGELWRGEFGKGNKTVYPVVVWNNIRVENYFCPEDGCRDKIRGEIARANKSIIFLMFSFTDDFLGNDLVIKHEEGVVVRGVFEKTKLSEYSEFNKLSYQGIDVRLDKNKYNMHHKVWIIDNRTVITGSFNPSANAEYDNDENILIIEDPVIARYFIEEFDRIWGKE
jgi:phosphatidylserine/phosphatidylglycerophosphate/cardiolipin synthase-like enzyme